MNISSSDRLVITIVFFAYIVILLAYGLYTSKAMKNTKDADFMSKFATGGKSAGTFVTAMTICAGIAGAGVFLGVPGYIVTYGSVWLVCCFWSMSCTLNTMGTFGKKTGIVGRRANAQTFSELLMHRYENDRLFAGVCSLIVLIFLGVFAVSTITGGARIVQTLTGLPYPTGLIIFTALVIISAVTGGFKGVTTQIVIQGVVMTAAVIILFFFGINSAGSLGEAVRTIADKDPSWWGMNLSWKTVLTYAFLWGLSCFSLPHVTMGSLSYSSTDKMHKAIKVGLICYTIWLIGLNLLAIPAKATFADSLASADMTTPTMAMTAAPNWVAGLILAGVCAAVQSSIGGMILTLATAFSNDFIKRCLKPDMEPAQLKKWTNIGTVIVGAVVMFAAWNPPALLANLITYGTGGLMAAFFGTMILGFYWPRSNKYGAYVNMIGGIAIYILMDLNIIPKALAFGFNPSIMASLYAMVLHVIVSLATPKTKFGYWAIWFAEDYPEEYGCCETGALKPGNKK